MRSTATISIGAMLIFVLAACGAAPAVSDGAAPPSAAAQREHRAGASASTSPEATASAAASPTAASGGLAGTATGSDCSALPSPDANGQTATTEYPDLLAMIPEELGGQPTHSRQSFRVVEFLCLAGGQAVVDEVVGASPDGFDLTAVQYAGASVNLGEPTSGVAIIRTPGADATFMAENFARVIPLIAGSTEVAEGEVVGGHARRQAHLRLQPAREPVDLPVPQGRSPVRHLAQGPGRRRDHPRGASLARRGGVGPVRPALRPERSTGTVVRPP